jgi:uncharacterized membrane protein
MYALTQEFVDACPIEQGFRLRGLEMTRTEVFVDAAFAFALTLLVISFDAIPKDWDEVILAIKNIPAFAASVAMLAWIWYEHSVWSKRYGLDDAKTAFLSTMLLIVMLVYIYPLRMMAGGMFAWFSDSYLPQSFELQTLAQLAGMFVFLGACFAALCVVFVLLNLHAASRYRELRLSAEEIYKTRTSAGTWAGSSAVGLISVVAAVTLPGKWVPYSGFAYAILGLWIWLFPLWREKNSSQ